MGINRQDTYKHRFAYADAFRALAIFGVILTHCVRQVTLLHHTLLIYPLGVLCVNVFFMLSGYLLARPFLNSIINQTNFPDWKVFMQRRFLRIYPAYAAAVAISALGFAYDSSRPIPFILTHLTFLHGFLNREVIARNAPLWTMAVDVEFYLALPIFAYFLYSIARRKNIEGRVQLILHSLIAVTFVAILWRMIMYPIEAYFTDPLVPAGIYFTLMRNLIGVAGGFAFGGIIALLEIRHDQFAALTKDNRLLGIAILLVVVNVVRCVLKMPAGLNDMGEDIFSAIAVSLLFFELSLGKIAALNTFVRSKVVKVAADYSYSVYLIHWMCLWWARVPLAKMLKISSHLMQFALAAVMTAILAFCIHLFVEQPFLKLKGRLSPTQVENGQSVGAVTAP